jgi:hypothetical protein
MKNLYGENKEIKGEYDKEGTLHAAGPSLPAVGLL